MSKCIDKVSQWVIDSGKFGCNKSWRYPLLSKFIDKNSHWAIDKRQNWGVINLGGILWCQNLLIRYRNGLLIAANWGVINFGGALWCHNLVIRNRNGLLIAAKLGVINLGGILWCHNLVIRNRSGLLISGKIGYNKSWRYPLLSKFIDKSSHWGIDKRQNWGVINLGGILCCQNLLIRIHIGLLISGKIEG